MNEIRYCRRCNSIYKYNNVNLCTACLKVYDEIMLKTEKYLREHPMADISEIEQAIGEKKKDLLYLLRMGRLSIVTESQLLSCSRCGKKIKRGKYCKSCSDVIHEQLNGAVNTPSNSTVKSITKENSSDATTNKMFTIYRHID